jgi:hypothetical protein
LCRGPIRSSPAAFSRAGKGTAFRGIARRHFFPARRFTTAPRR